MTVITIPPLSPFPGRGAAPEGYIAQADTTMQELPGVIGKMNEVSAALNLGASVLQNGYLPPVLYAPGLSINSASTTICWPWAGHFGDHHVNGPATLECRAATATFL